MCIRFLILFFLGVSALGLAGCLQTRGDVKEQEEKQVLQKQVKNLQVTTADVNTKFQEIDDDLRRLTGRIEVIESKQQQVIKLYEKAESQDVSRGKETEAKLEVYKEAIAKLEVQVSELGQALVAMQEHQKRVAQAPAPSTGKADSAKSVYAQAEELFQKKQWKDAILEYERFRKGNAKSKQFASATYKIGVCFLELGLGDDAKAFFDEVITKFADSPEAEKAKSKLKALKKKK